MTPQEFLTDFSHTASAPNGMQKLREMVLQLAVQGRLVHHIPDDGDVDEELARIKRLREEYENELGMRRSRHTEAEGLGAIPYTIPTHWRWTQLGDVARYVQRGKGPKYADRGSVRVVSQKCIQWKSFDESVARWIDDGSIEDYSQERFLQPGDLLWNSTGTGTAGRIGIYPAGIEGRSVADSHVTIIRLAGVDSRFLWCHIASPGVQARIEPTHPQALVSGTTNQVELATGSVRALPIPLPPLAEQKRIVAKVDELMALCDRLEVLQNQRKAARAVLTKEILGRVASDAKVDAQTCLQNLSLLASDVEQIPVLRQTILSLAVQGKLVPQDPGDEPAILGLKTNGISVLPDTVPVEEQRFVTPASWVWIRFAQVGEQRLGKMLDARKNKGALKPYLRNTNVQWMRFELGDVKEMRLESRDLFDLRLEPGDLLICEGGEPGRCAIWSDASIEMYFQKALHRVRPCSVVLVQYLAMNLQLDCGNEVISRYFTGATIKHLTGRSLERYPIPLPPLAEQKRIVAKVDELMALCDTLEAKLRKAGQVQEQLAISSIAALTGIQSQEKETMKAPKTELVARLKIGKKPTTKDQAPLAALLVRHSGELSPKELWQQSEIERIEDFYRKLKMEMTAGWIVEPEKAEFKEVGK